MIKPGGIGLAYHSQTQVKGAQLAMPAKKISPADATLRLGERLLWRSSPNPIAWTFVRIRPFSLLVPAFLVILVPQADFSRGLPRYGGDLLLAALIGLISVAIHKVVSRGSRSCEYLITDQRVVVVRPVVMAPPFVHRPEAVECAFADLPEPEVQRLPFAFGYGNVYFGMPTGWQSRPPAFPFAFVPLETMEFFAIPDWEEAARIRGGSSS